MKLYNTLTRQIDELKPLSPPEVTVYTCGPTVYDYPQIGNWFTYVRWDTLIRTLKASGYTPKWVLNFTDVGHLVSDADEGEDKLEKGARREGKTAQDIAQFYTEDFLQGMQKLNILQPTVTPKATEHINEQIDLIKKLEEKGYTYTISDGIYYDTSKFSRYADFAKLDLDEQQAGARVDYNSEKRNPSDFALWKFSPKDQKRDMEWDSPWGTGFPGWHIECSAMSMKYLGETLDIHTGGIDHIPVHHTNEIAQSEAITGKTFANMWLHGNHITVNGEKISKSLGNGIRLQDIAAKDYDPLVLRLHVLESHYRSQSKFSWESLSAAQNRLKRFYEWADLKHQFRPTDAASETPQELLSDDLLTVLANDLDTPQLLAIMELKIDFTYQHELDSRHTEAFQNLLNNLDAFLGLNLSNRDDINGEQKELIAQRQDARDNKDWAESDKLRDQLTNQGIGVRDTARGARWYRL